ncbi:hypothetical protein BD626DRAFT_511162 [Schizophyllum amplum]|uniref:Uncharacterized protein n=1 Tax=Schizophyllum amplum TaxID=97359 RepID=A0A550C0Y6_9AGAR|nr:hypothetical protein BD626DRAFT_511162 [Auriculariopsis ampla]
MSISAYTATESISSVRQIPAPHAGADPLSRSSSHTLVEGSGYRALPNYNLAVTAPVARLAPPSHVSAATVSTGRVARPNNLPKEPQDTQVQCVGDRWKHRWTVHHANGQQRTYFCWDCGAEVKEKIDHVQGKWLQSGVSRRDVSMARHIAVS